MCLFQGKLKTPHKWTVAVVASIPPAKNLNGLRNRRISIYLTWNMSCIMWHHTRVDGINLGRVHLKTMLSLQSDGFFCEHVEFCEVPGEFGQGLVGDVRVAFAN